MLDHTPPTDTPLVEVLECFDHGFITYGEYQLYQLRRIDTPEYRALVARLAGVDLEAALVTDEALASAYHRFMCSFHKL